MPPKIAVIGTSGSGKTTVARELERADTVVWLDLPLRVALSRVTRRTIGRIRAGEELWSGNRESWRGGFFGWDSMVVWAIRSHLRLRRARATRLAAHPHL